MIKVEVSIHITSAKRNWEMAQFAEGEIHHTGFFLGYPENILTNTLNEKIFESVNDNYALVIDKNDDYVLAAVDHIRSIPLFYHFEKNKCFYLTDDPLWLKETINATEFDKISKTEFLYSGYVIGNKTLYEGVHQLQAGEYLIYDVTSGELTIKNHFQYKPFPVTSKEKTIDDLIEEMGETHKQIGKRLVESLNGKRAVIPLSGGYDSRLILDILVKEKYDNIFTFTYGRKFFNHDTKVSRHVAEYYKVPWHAEYLTRKDWYHGFRSDVFKEFSSYGHDLTSLAHIQDFLAVYRMHSKNIFLEEDVLIPGHTGDFIQGGHIPPAVNQKDFTTEILYDYIINKHFWLWSHDDSSRSVLKSSVSEYFTKRLHLTPGQDLSTEEATMAIEFFNWAERQSKYIVNSVRVYDFFNLGFRLPLWDLDMIDFWKKIPIELKIDRKLYKEYVKKYENFSFKEPFYLKGKWGKRIDYYIFHTLLAERYGRINGNKPALLAIFDKISINEKSRNVYSLNVFDYSIDYFGYLKNQKKGKNLKDEQAV